MPDLQTELNLINSRISYAKIESEGLESQIRGIQKKNRRFKNKY